jgi:alpha-aminoadipate carrier protein LysW
MKNNECADCGAEIKIPDDFVKGEIIQCPECSTDWEIASAKFDLTRAEKIGEDWGQ